MVAEEWVKRIDLPGVLEELLEVEELEHCKMG